MEPSNEENQRRLLEGDGDLHDIMMITWNERERNKRSMRGGCIQYYRWSYVAI
jgi:hypothetical protein